MKLQNQATVAKLATEQEIANPNDGTYYYVSLPYYNHKVLKCAGLVHAKLELREFYLDYWMTGKHDYSAVQGDRYQVVIVQGIKGQIPDRIVQVDGIWVEHSLCH